MVFLILFWFCIFLFFKFSALLVFVIILIIPVMVVNLRVTFLCFILCFPAILGSFFVLFLGLPIAIIYPFYFVIYPFYLDIPFSKLFPNVGYICLFPICFDLPLIVVLLISPALIFVFGVYLLMVCWWS